MFANEEIMTALVPASPKSALTRTLVVALTGGLQLSACTHTLDTEASDPSYRTDALELAGPRASAPVADAAGATFDPATLRTGKRRVLVDDIAAAENQWFTSSGRLLVSGDEGIYEIVVDAHGGHSARALQQGQDCQFGGMTELHGTLYANCYDSTDSTLFAAPLVEAPEFRAIYRLPGTGLANGLTSDGDAHLFVASSFDGSVIRLTPSASDPLTIESRDTFLPDSGFITNGIKYFAGTLYWTALLNVNSASISPSGEPGMRQTLLAALTLFDDLFVDESGILVADYLNGKVIAVPSGGGRQLSSPDGSFDGPSSVQPALGRLGLPAHALIVTERNANRVSLLVP